MLDKQRIYSEAGFSGNAREVSRTITEDDGEVFTKECYVRIMDEPEGITPDQTREGLRGLYAKSCTCEHDCCGHYFGGIMSDILYKAGMYEFTAKYFRNV